METAQDQPSQRVMPTLRMTDYAKSKAFYVDGLGFKIDWEHRFDAHLPVFIQVSRDGLAFFVTRAHRRLPNGRTHSSVRSRRRCMVCRVHGQGCSREGGAERGPSGAA